MRNWYKQRQIMVKEKQGYFGKDCSNALRAFLFLAANSLEFSIKLFYSHTLKTESYQEPEYTDVGVNAT